MACMPVCILLLMDKILHQLGRLKDCNEMNKKCLSIKIVVVTQMKLRSMFFSFLNFLRVSLTVLGLAVPFSLAIVYSPYSLSAGVLHVASCV